VIHCLANLIQSNHFPSSNPGLKKPEKRVKWADHFGGALSISQLVEDGETAEGENPIDASVSWTDRKKRDRIREKDLLAKAK
jgi:hypothetical protein